MLKLQKDIKKYLKERRWDKLSPADLAKSISIEAAELLENFQWSNPTSEEIKSNKEQFSEIKNEIADVFIYCMDMADRLGFDIEEVTYDKLDTVKKKYPAKLFRENESVPGTELYWKIKKEHRINSQK